MDDFLEGYDPENLKEATRLYTRHYARTFYFASFMLPKQKREAAYAVYAFCRYADNLFDDRQKYAEDPLVKLSVLKNELKKIESSSGKVHPRLSALAEVISEYEIPVEYFSELLEGVVMDHTISRYETWKELELYCYRVASVVGLIMAHIFGVSDRSAYDHAVELGKAMQLTNILRDVREDFLMGRIYLPGEELRSFDMTAEDLSRAEVTPDFVGMMKFQIARARSFYRAADKGIPYLADDGGRFCVRVMSSLYERILDVIERNHYDVFRHRATVSLGEKVLQLIKLKLTRHPVNTIKSAPAHAKR